MHNFLLTLTYLTLFTKSTAMPNQSITGWHICLIDKTDSHCPETGDKLSKVYSHHSLSHSALIIHCKHSLIQAVKLLSSYCFLNVRVSLEGISLKIEGKEQLTACNFTFFFSFVVVQIDLKYCRIPNLSKLRSLTPLENNQSDLWAALKSPLLSHYKRLTTVSCKASKWRL